MSYALSSSNWKQQICEPGAVVFYATVLLLASSFPSKMLKSISFKWNWYNLINYLFSRTKFTQYWHLVQRQNSRRCPRNSLQKPRWLPRWFLRIDMHWWCCLGFKITNGFDLNILGVFLTAFSVQKWNAWHSLSRHLNIIKHVPVAKRRWSKRTIISLGGVKNVSNCLAVIIFDILITDRLS